MKKSKNNLQLVKHFVVSAFIVGTLASCNDTSQPETDRTDETSHLEQEVNEEVSPDAKIEGWELVWSDEFNGEGAVDTEKWSYRIWDPKRVNNELQAYTNRIENSFQKDGSLTIKALNDSSGGSKYTSARIVTEDIFEFTYGKVEARAIVPGGRGSWPAIWMLGANIGEVGWPTCGEIDIMEYVGYNPGFIHGTAHAKNYYWKIEEQQTQKIPVTGVEEEYHTYGIEWFEDHLDFLFDGEVYLSAVPKGGDKDNLDAWPFSLPHFLILNVAVGGDWGGQKGVDDTAFPMEMKIDYVRVYQKEK